MSGILESLAEARIWVIDDEPANVRLITRLLQRSGYVNVGGTTNPREAVACFPEDGPDLVLLDLNMPDLDGFGVLEHLRGTLPANAYVPVLCITGLPTSEAKERALSLGAKDFVRKPFEAAEVLLRIRNLLETRALHLQMDRKVRERTRELDEAKYDVLRRLARAAEYRDDDTGQHTQRVGEVAALVAREMGLEPVMVERIRQAAPLHDVGKIGIPDAILLKPGSLTPEEFAVMRTHTTIGAELLSGGVSPLMDLAATIARSHHEWWDGSGYPDGRSGEAIPLAARIVAVADVFDALSHARPYRPAWPIERIVDEIRTKTGRHFDPDVADAFLKLLPRLTRLRTVADLAVPEAAEPALLALPVLG
jgi:putative two-component system response regulator